MTVWVISRMPVKATESNWTWFDVGYVKSAKEAERILAHNKRYASMYYKYKMQKLDLMVNKKK